MIIDTTNANILIVDDQEINVRLLEKILAQAGYRNVTSITDSREVEELYTSRQFDLILLKDVIEHIPDQERVIPYLKEFLKPGGRVFFGFPPWYMPHGGHQQRRRVRRTEDRSVVAIR